MSSRQTIELNGQFYDARTGHLVSTDETQPAVTTPETLPAQQKPAAIDGFAKSAHPPRRVVDSAHHTGPQKSQTLKRSLVQKPALAQKATSHAPKQPAKHTAHPAASLHRRSTDVSVPASRLQRMQSVTKSHQISRFPVQSGHSALVKKAKAKSTGQAPQHIVKAVSSVVEKPVGQFDAAIANATSHTESKPKKAPLRHRVANRLGIKSKTLNIASFSVAVLLLIGYFGYQNAPNLAMRVAAIRSEVHGTLPSYRPAGFRLSRAIEYQPGKIVLTYTSNSDNRQFSVTQAKSPWDSDALHEHFVADRQQVRTVQDKGKTIYLYDDSNATWVDGGIWFKIEGNSSLSSEQLSRLASSF